MKFTVYLCHNPQDKRTTQLWLQKHGHVVCVHASTHCCTCTCVQTHVHMRFKTEKAASEIHRGDKSSFFGGGRVDKTKTKDYFNNVFWSKRKICKGGWCVTALPRRNPTCEGSTRHAAEWCSCFKWLFLWLPFQQTKEYSGQSQFQVPFLGCVAKQLSCAVGDPRAKAFCAVTGWPCWQRCWLMGSATVSCKPSITSPLGTGYCPGRDPAARWVLLLPLAMYLKSP